MTSTLSAETFSQRRTALAKEVHGPILLQGNGLRARNLPMTRFPFRQDSTFLYFTGCSKPYALALLQDGHCTLFLPAPEEDDALWHGPTPTFETLTEHYGVDCILPIEQLKEVLGSSIPKTLAVPDENQNRKMVALLGNPLQFGVAHGDESLVQAIIALRRTKSEEELQELRQAAVYTTAAHRAVMRSTHPGTHERSLAALFDGVLASNGCTTGYHTILTQRGEVLHNEAYSDVLSDKKLLLIDGGGELPSGYGSDVTRTYPVSGKFSPRQRAVYEAVLASQKAAIAHCRAGVPYREVHDIASGILAEFLCEEGLIRTDPKTALECGAHALFFPHGIGHLLGMDVHDLENFGDLPAYPEGIDRPSPFGTCYLRLNLPLEANWVVTVEPGIYFVPEILHRPAFREQFRDVVDFDQADQWIGFGGIRIEDDIVVTKGEPENLTGHIEKEIDALESIVGSGICANTLLS